MSPRVADWLLKGVLVLLAVYGVARNDHLNGGPDNDQPELRSCGKLSGQLWQLSRTNTR